jgi:hypothetical protein
MKRHEHLAGPLDRQAVDIVGANDFHVRSDRTN